MALQAMLRGTRMEKHCTGFVKIKKKTRDIAARAG
jgi:hypothetical protein